MENIHYWLIVLTAVFTMASPGPATLSIARISMNQGRTMGMTLALGVFTGSLLWSIAAAFGLATLMYTHSWLAEIFRYCGASYLLYLAYKAVQSALSTTSLMAVSPPINI